jgi:hypothetical protein
VRMTRLLSSIVDSSLSNYQMLTTPDGGCSSH